MGQSHGLSGLSLPSSKLRYCAPANLAPCSSPSSHGTPHAVDAPPLAAGRRRLVVVPLDSDFVLPQATAALRALLDRLRGGGLAEGVGVGMLSMLGFESTCEHLQVSCRGRDRGWGWGWGARRRGARRFCSSAVVAPMQCAAAWRCFEMEAVGHSRGMQPCSMPPAAAAEPPVPAGLLPCRPRVWSAMSWTSWSATGGGGHSYQGSGSCMAGEEWFCTQQRSLAAGEACACGGLPA